MRQRPTLKTAGFCEVWRRGQALTGSGYIKRARVGVPTPALDEIKQVSSAHQFWKVTLRAVERLNVEPPAGGSRNQHWNFHVEPVVRFEAWGFELLFTAWVML
jgi:hypothetical protein